MCAEMIGHRVIAIINRNEIVEITEKDTDGSGNTKVRYVVFFDPDYGDVAVRFKTFRELCDWVRENLI